MRAMADNEQWMRLALREALRGVGKTSPNPMVGALIVSARGRLLAAGWHRAAGSAHAEIDALRRLQMSKGPGRARGATLYVTLEPCSTVGRTPPCVEAIIEAGFARVVVGAIDPNPAHAGHGLEILRMAGIAVTTGVLEEKAMALNAAFNKWIVTRMPLVIAKCALTLDGRITRLPEEGQWLTGGAARRDAHRLRARVDAILVGAGTVLADDPQLTVRGVRLKKQPWRVVLAGERELPAGAKLLSDEHRERTLMYRNKRLETVLRDLGQREVTSVLIEGGARVLGEAFDGELVDQVRFYVAPLISGGGKMAVGGRGDDWREAPRLRNVEYRRVGPDLVLAGEVQYPGNKKKRSR
jgi:diaminohydroxyphosphoribosylaminopyrimidine deaminase/5-amino-6-(5-phosphoribosylamino)uracil reductase